MEMKHNLRAMLGVIQNKDPRTRRPEKEIQEVIPHALPDQEVYIINFADMHLTPQADAIAKMKCPVLQIKREAKALAKKREAIKDQIHQLQLEQENSKQI